MRAVELKSIDYGNGSPLVILHGVFGSARNWSSIAQRLAVAHKVLALNARYHGASPWADTMSYADIVDGRCHGNWRSGEHRALHLACHRSPTPVTTSHPI